MCTALSLRHVSLTLSAESRMAKSAFDTFIPLSVTSEAREKIIFSFFDLLAAIAASSKRNGLGGRKLSRLAGWWAFEQIQEGQGFQAGYRSWTRSSAFREGVKFTANACTAPRTQRAISFSPIYALVLLIQARQPHPFRNYHDLYKLSSHRLSTLPRRRLSCRATPPTW